MTQNRRQRSDSISAAVAAHLAVTKTIPPPEPLPKALLTIWKEVVEMRASAEWSPIDLRQAHSLVLALGELREQEQRLLHEPGLKRTRAGMRPNPRLEVVERLTARILRLQTRLLLTPRASGYRSDRVAAQRQLEKEARARADPVGAFLESGGDPLQLLLGMGWPADDPRSEILPQSGDGPVRGSGKARPQ